MTKKGPIRIYYTDNYMREPHSYLAPAKATLDDVHRYLGSLERAGYSAWMELEFASWQPR